MRGRVVRGDDNYIAGGILAELQQDSSMINVDLAERVHLSPSPCLMRMKALENAA